MLLAILAIAILGLLANAVVDTTKSWHPLQQVAKSDTDITSVDENNNKIIDEAETLSLVGGVATIGNPASSTALAIKGVGTGWSAIDFYSGNTNLWGMGRDSSGYFYIDRTGVGRALTIDASRNVGIGTTSPGNKLTVIGDIGVSGAIRKTDANGATQIYIDSGGNDAYISNQLAGALIFRTDIVERMRIDRSGNIGIGTTAPTQKLDVIGYVRGSSGLCIGGDCRTAWPSGGISSETDTLQTVTNRGASTTQSITANDFWTNSWFYVPGSGGIYWSVYRGGWYMEDSTWIRAYNNKNIYTGGQVRGDSGICIGGSCKTSWIVNWGEISGIPAGFADGVDNGANLNEIAGINCNWDGGKYVASYNSCTPDYIRTIVWCSGGKVTRIDYIMEDNSASCAG